MITKFDSLFAGHADLDNVGYAGTPINDRLYDNAHLLTALTKAENMAKLMDRHGYNCFWMAEHHFQREGTECIPNNLMMARASRAPHQEHQDRLRLQHRADVASAAAGGGLRRRRFPDRRPRRVRAGPRLPHARGGDLRRPAARPGRQPRALRGADRHHLQGLQRGVVLAQGQVLHAAARGPLSRLYAEGADPGAAAGQPAGRVLAADPGRLAARARVHGQARHPGHGRRRLGRGRRHAQRGARLAGGACQARQGDRARRAAVLRLPLLHGRQPREGHEGGRASTTRRT